MKNAKLLLGKIVLIIHIKGRCKAVERSVGRAPFQLHAYTRKETKLEQPVRKIGQFPTPPLLKKLSQASLCRWMAGSLQVSEAIGIPTIPP